MEIWNNVFSQFNNMGDGTYTELEHKNIDTGMGLERLACVMQDVDNMFEVDTIRNILNKVCELAHKEYGKNAANDISIRAITDHSRAATFMISDGIIPSNEGRGYVLRRLIRRAARHGRMLGIEGAFLPILCDSVINENKSGYPELLEKQELIKKVISFEEAAFAKTIDQGLALLDELTKGDVKELSGADAFKLYDTYGFPVDLTKDILAEKNITVDEEEFTRLMTEQRQKSREGRKASDAESWKSDDISFDLVNATEFLGYNHNETTATVLAIVSDNEQVSTVTAGNKAVIVLDKTVFYAESGGQVGDTGEITSGDTKIAVTGTTKNGSGIFTHFCVVENGQISVGDTVTAKIDVERRNAIRRNHTAAHLLQAGLRAVLGTHVEQAGQLVNDTAVRFDFTHFSALTNEEIQKVEAFVNGIILSGAEVVNKEMPIEEAKKLGAMALFGEKYGDIVRVVAVEDKSIEFCGGTHVDNAGKIGLFRILSESGVAAGVRRIEAVTGYNTLALIDRYESLIHETAQNMKISNVFDIASRSKQLAAELKENEKKIEKLEAQIAAGKLDEIMQSAKEINGLRVITAVIENSSADEIRSMSETLKANNGNVVSVLAGVTQDKITFCAACGKDAISRGNKAGEIVKQVALVTGGNGGGKPDIAMAGGKDKTKVNEALAVVETLIK